MKLLKILLPLSFLLISSPFANSHQRMKNFEQLYQIDLKSNISKDRILKGIKYAELCHLSDQEDQAILAKYPKAFIHETKENEVNFFIIKNHLLKIQTLAIRGSTTTKNWIQDAKFFKVKDPWAKNSMIHKGFYQAARELYPIAKKHLNKTYKTKITGHSLGGGIAILIGVYLERDHFKEIQVITFGQPRITDKKGAFVLRHLALERVTVKMDLVPSLPPKFLGYRHFGNSLIISEKDLFQNTRLVESDKKDSQEVLNAWNDLNQNIKVMKTDFKSHRLRNYLKRLYGALGR
ncbi:lipase family protein [bacterium]|nr:lipase family protein [bacterium]